MPSTASKYVDPSVETDLYAPDDEDGDSTRTSALQAGWDVASKTVLSSKKFTQDFKFDTSPKLIAFLDNAPFASYAQHWLNERDGKKSFPCRMELDGQCPLCDIGSAPIGRAVFSVVEIGEDDEFEVQMLQATSKLYSQLRDLNNDKFTGPLNKNFWRVSHTKVNKSTSYNFQSISPRDLAESFGIDVDSLKAQLSELTPLTSTAIHFPSRAELQEVADEVTSR